MGGVARRATLIRAERSRVEHTLLLDAGNSLMGNQNPASSSRGRTSVEAMNMMQYDAMALGLKDISSLSLAELRQRMEEANFPILSANAFVVGTEDLAAEPYRVIPLADHRVGILGLTDVGATNEVRVADPLEAAKTWLPQLRKEADIIILLSHAGLDADEAVAKQLPGIDIVVSGGDKTTTQPVVIEPTGTFLFHADIAMSGSAGQRVGVAHLTFSPDGRLQEHEWVRVELYEDFDEDPEMSVWLDSLQS